MKKLFPFYIATTVLLIIIRITINKSPEQTFIVACINLLALLLVVISITEQIRKRIIKKLKCTGNPPDIIAREIKHHSFWISFISYTVFIAFAVLYLCFIQNELANDILSIVSLGIAICDAYIAEIISNIIKL